jgi:CubicO group peptidase (beta-lactamase class C family)
MRPILVFLFLMFLHGQVFCQRALTNKLEEYFDAQVRVNHFSGTVLVVRNDTVLLKKAAGKADHEWGIPNAPDTKFSLASVSKHITAIAIMQLAEQGKLRVTDKLSAFFPDFPKADSITLHMLLTHTSGLALDFDELYVFQGNITPDSAYAYLKTRPLLFSPGKGLSYSNIGYYLLGRIIEKASGQPMEAYLAQHVFGPAGMHHSGVNSIEDIIPRKARVYHRYQGKLRRGHDGIYSTVEDLYRLDQALNGNKLLSEASKQLMNTPYNKDRSQDGFFQRYGYGIMINPYFNLGHELLTHSGGFGGSVSSYNRYVKDKVFIAALSNTGSEAHTLSYSLAAIVFGMPVSLPYQPVAKSVPLAVYERYAGRYGKVEIVLKEGKLFNKTAEAELVPESETKFFYAHNPNRTVEFVTGKKKKRPGRLILTKGGVQEVYDRTDR